ncbi:hypothetical protein [Sporosarcina sp. BP05]|uniref:hypothetical protein n=1 Tax=Sporosarcina sp. BP05 TaxID=2758726 RepID=UPI0016491E93|nr:hypothetical protein [Sporosarcina sp. BP05]
MEQNVSELEQSPNLFSKAVLAAIYLNKTKLDADARFVFKVKLLRELLHDENIQRPSISALFYFIDYLLRLPEQLKESLRVELQEEDFQMLHFEKNNVPPTVAELMAMDRAEGIKEGITEERRALARSMITKGYSNEEIMGLLPLSEEEIASLRLTK